MADGTCPTRRARARRLRQKRRSSLSKQQFASYLIARVELRHFRPRPNQRFALNPFLVPPHPLLLHCLLALARSDATNPATVQRLNSHAPLQAIRDLADHDAAEFEPENADLVAPLPQFALTRAPCSRPASSHRARRPPPAARRPRPAPPATPPPSPSPRGPSRRSRQRSQCCSRGRCRASSKCYQ